MKAAVYHGARDVRLETVPEPVLKDPTDALVRVTQAAICGSDLWFYRGITQWEPGDRTGHEFIGVVEAVGQDVRSVGVGDHVIAPFVSSDGSCEYCRLGLQTSCERMSNWGDDKNGGQAEAVRVPFADGTLVPMRESVYGDARKRLGALALCDVMGTGHHGVVSSLARPGGTVTIVGDGAVGLCAAISAAKQIGAERVIAVGHNDARLAMAKRFGATETFNSHDPNVAARILESTHGGSLSVVEAVGNQESMELALEIARPGGTVSFVGVPANVQNLPLRPLFAKNVQLRGALAPTRAYIPELLASVESGRIDPSPVFDLALPLDRVADGYKAMDSREAIKVVLEV